jgi:hypothetical protein
MLARLGAATKSISEAHDQQPRSTSAAARVVIGWRKIGIQTLVVACAARGPSLPHLYVNSPTQQRPKAVIVPRICEIRSSLACHGTTRRRTWGRAPSTRPRGMRAAQLKSTGSRAHRPGRHPPRSDNAPDMAAPRFFAPPSLDTIAPELLERIALYVAVSQEPHKPSPGLAALLRTCRRVYATLNPDRNHILWAHVFGERFDLGAPARRLGPGYTTPANLTCELRHRIYSLRRIQHCYTHPETIAYDLWIVCAMLSLFWWLFSG